MHWRGELLDGAALAAQELGRPDLSKRLEAAWRVAPTLTRLVRWLVADGLPRWNPLRVRAAKALSSLSQDGRAANRTAARYQGDVRTAAEVLAKADPVSAGPALTIPGTCCSPCSLTWLSNRPGGGSATHS